MVALLVMSLVLSADPAPTPAFVVASTANVRAKPDAKATLVTRLPINSKVDVLERGAEWTRIKSGKRTGWISSASLGPQALTVQSAIEALDAATDPPTQRTWAERAAAIAPDDPAVLQRLVEVLHRAGDLRAEASAHETLTRVRAAQLVKWHRAPKPLFEQVTIEIGESQEGDQCSNCFSVSYASTGTFLSGDYAGHELVRLAIAATDCKSDDCNVPRFFRFARSKGRFVFLPRISNARDPAVAGFPPERAFGKKKVLYSVDTTFSVPGLEYAEPGATPKLQLVAEHHGSEVNRADLAPLLIHPQLGPLYAPREELPSLNGPYPIYVFRPDGSVLQLSAPSPPVDAVTWKSGKREHFKLRPIPMPNGTGGIAAAYVEAGELEVAGKTDSGAPVYRIADAAHEAIAALDTKTLAGTDARELVAFVPDELGKLRPYLDERLPMYWSEPIIYLYPPAPMDVTVRVRPQLGITKSEPPYEDGWSVRAAPNGQLVHRGARHRYLFWEGETLPQPMPREGTVVARANVEAHLRIELAARGLTERETRDFLIAWLSRLMRSPFVLLSFVEKQELDAIAPLEVVPAPDTIIRVGLIFRGLGSRIVTEPQQTPALPPNRIGFTVVEWGGAER